MKKITARENKTLPIAIAFIGVVFAIVIISFAINLIHIISLSKFDGSHQFVLFIQSANQTGELVDYSPETQSLFLVNLKDMIDVTHVGQLLEIPIDATVRGDAHSLDTINLLLQHPSGNVEWIDDVKLWWFGHQVKPENTTTSTIDFSALASAQTVIESNFIDKTLYSENKTIAVINASGVTGKGNQLAKLLTNMGANVISVTGDREQDTSSISYIGMLSYSAKRIHRLLMYPLSQLPSKPAIAVITIVIGKDSSTSAIF